MNSNLKVAAVAVLSSIATLGAYHFLGLGASSRDVVFSDASSQGSLAKLANFTAPSGVPGDFTYAAEISTPAVVHIKSKSSARQSQTTRRASPFDDFFGGDLDQLFGGRGQSGPQESSGSGVIISADGFIATNNHVVEGSDELEVITSDKKSYKATIVGTDPSTDIAVIKIEASNMPTLAFGNSDAIKVGEWVLAVGNPFNLESTVTAGIVSAKSRNINILQGKPQRQGMTASQRGDSPIESFIQTDAAVNPGNSGGALVNLRGELIGINTAIASPNGAYAGYAFAVPASIIKKVTADLVKFGNVQRGYLGIGPQELNNKVAEELGIKQSSGIYVGRVEDGGAAKAAGIKEKDVILKIDGQDVKTEPQFREMIGRKRPGDNVSVTVDRDGSIKDYTVTLRNLQGGKDFLKPDASLKSFEKLGINIEDLSAEQKKKTGLSSGVMVKEIDQEGEIGSYTDMQQGFVITKIDGKAIANVKDLKTAILDSKSAKKDVLICGIYPGYSRNYCFGLPYAGN
jgi:serine protease Do